MPVWAQRGISTSHPRMILDSTRLAALIAKIQAGGQPATDLAALRTVMENSNHLNCTRDGGGHTTSCAATQLAGYTDNANLLNYAVPGFLYQVYTGLGDTVTANTFADALIDKGLNESHTCWIAGNCVVTTDEHALGAEGASLGADWVWPRIVSRGLTATVIANQKKIYTDAFIDSSFQTYIRETDNHNYTLGWLSAWTATGLVLSGEDASADAIVNKAAGMLFEGWSYDPTGYGESFTFNFKTSLDTLTGGAGNFEGGQYWRSAMPEAFRAIEEYDTSTSRVLDLWTSFSNLSRAGLYRIYITQPDGNNAGIGDATTGNPTVGRDNFGMVVLTDRLVSGGYTGYYKTFMDGIVAPWNSGADDLGLMWKLLFYPYTGVTAVPYTTLPLIDRFGNDTIFRTGWASTDTFFVMESGYSGAYHRGMAQGAFHLFSGSNPVLMRGAPYASSTGDFYYNLFRRTLNMSGGILTYNSSECWRDTTINCTLSNDGGQRYVGRRYNPPFPTLNEYGVNKLWSATLLSSSAGNNYPEQYTVAPTSYQIGTGYGLVTTNDTKAYSNLWSVDPDSPGTFSPNHNGTKRISLSNRTVVFSTTNGDTVMFDIVNSTRSTFTKKLILHSVGAPTIGSTVTTPGDNTYNSQSAIKVDNVTGRAFGKVLLPAVANIRVVGGNGCSPVTISSMPIANPLVVTTSGVHGIVDGEQIGLQFGSSPGDWVKIGANNSSGYFPITAHVTDTTHFSIYYQGVALDTTCGSCGAGINSPATAPTPTIIWHEKCSYEGFVDDLQDPADPTGVLRISKNVWVPQATYAASSIVSPQYRTEIMPSVAALNDFFLVVYRPTTTSNNTAPTATLVTSTQFYGALVDSTSVTVFNKVATPLTSGSYTVTTSGTAKHILTGLLANAKFNVLQGAGSIGPITAGTAGAFTFTESATGGTITISHPVAVLLGGNAMIGALRH